MRDIMLPRKNYNVNEYFYKYERPATGDNNCMKTDIIDTDDKYFIVIDIPGVKKENIMIDYENGYLNIKVMKLDETGISYVRRERFVGDARRSFYIGSKREEDIKASCKDGVLEISFPKQELPKKNSKNIVIE